jgi:outer membrane receptor protein involved in Fe transport
VIRRCLARETALVGWALLASSSLAFSQAAAGTAGSVEGVVRDPAGRALPGVTVVLSGPAIVGQRAATTDVDGRYRFPVLPAGTYDVTYELLGHETAHREAVAVTAGEAVAVSLALAPVAVPAEPVTVPAGPPVVEAKTTAAPPSFPNKEKELDGVPSAADLWAVLDYSPGVQVRGYDVGGSHKGQQTAYETFGIRGQNRILQDGVNTTEGTGHAGGYYDYYATDEIEVGAQGLDVEMSTPGAQVVAGWKSGANRFSGVLQGDFTTADFISDNIDEELALRGATSAKIHDSYDYHLDLGGPIVKDRAWFFVAYSRSYRDQDISGRIPDVATEIADIDTFTGKLTARPSSRDKLTAFGHWSFKQQPHRGLSSTVPLESSLAQESWTRFFKVDWQRTWSDTLSSDIMVGHFGYDWDMVPLVDPASAPPRIDTATGVQSGAGWAPFTFNRWKPQSTGRFTWSLPTASLGRHELKFGWDWQIDRGAPAWSDASGAIRYLDNSAYGRATTLEDVFVDRILFANVPNQGGTSRNQHTDFFAQDVWRVNGRLSLTLGARVGRQHVYYTDTTNDPLETDIFVPTSVPRGDVIDRWSFAPRLGATIDLTGRGESVIKAFFGRFYANLGSGIEEANPAGRGLRIYEFRDLNGNGLYDGTQDLGKLLDASGGGATRVDPNFELPYSDELSLSFEHELAADLGVRFSFVHKRYRNWWSAHVNRAQALNLTNPVTAICAGCPLGLDGSEINLLTIPDEQETLVDPWVANVPLLPTTGGDNTDMTFTNWQVALTRRFRNNFFLHASFDKHDQDELRSPEASTSPYVTDPLEQEWFLNHSMDVANRQETKYWAGKLLTRFVAPYEFGLALGVRYQSGFLWAPVYQLQVPNVGSKAILLANLEPDGRTDDVFVVDARLDKSWSFGGHYRLTVLGDLDNIFNANTATNFILYSGSRFNDVIAWLPGRTLRLGLRFAY